MEGVYNKILPLCKQHEISFFLFVPDENRWAWIPKPKEVVNTRLCVAAAITKDGTDKIPEAREREYINHMTMGYDDQFNAIINRGMNVMEKHNCERCFALWKAITMGKIAEIFDRETYIQQVRLLQLSIDKFCSIVDISVAFPSERDLRIYNESYYKTIDYIQGLLNEHEQHCVYVFGMEYFDEDEDGMKLKFYYGCDMGAPEITFIRDVIDNKN